MGEEGRAKCKNKMEENNGRIGGKSLKVVEKNNSETSGGKIKRTK